MPAANQPSELKFEGTRTADDVVCLVDDDPSIRKSVGRLLESAGFKVKTFDEAEPFLEYLSRNQVPVAVLDIWMEHMTGMELLAHLCARSPKTRIIFITGHEDSGAQATVMQAGAFGFLIKPFDEAKFLNLIGSAFAPDTLQTTATKMSDSP